MCTGRAAPSRIGPIVMPSPAAVFSRLKAILAASSVGMIRRFASSFRRERGKFASRSPASRAESPCISPSISSSGASARISSSAARIFCAEGASLVPKLECESRAALGTTPKRRITSAASAVISASCSAVGSRLT